MLPVIVRPSTADGPMSSHQLIPFATTHTARVGNADSLASRSDSPNDHVLLGVERGQVLVVPRLVAHHGIPRGNSLGFLVAEQDRRRHAHVSDLRPQSRHTTARRARTKRRDRRTAVAWTSAKLSKVKRLTNHQRTTKTNHSRRIRTCNRHRTTERQVNSMTRSVSSHMWRPNLLTPSGAGFSNGRVERGISSTRETG